MKIFIKGTKKVLNKKVNIFIKGTIYKKLILKIENENVIIFSIFNKKFYRKSTEHWLKTMSGKNA